MWQCVQCTLYTTKVHLTVYSVHCIRAVPPRPAGVRLYRWKTASCCHVMVPAIQHCTGVWQLLWHSMLISSYFLLLFSIPFFVSIESFFIRISVENCLFWDPMLIYWTIPLKDGCSLCCGSKMHHFLGSIKVWCCILICMRPIFQKANANTYFRPSTISSTKVEEVIQSIFVTNLAHTN